MLILKKIFYGFVLVIGFFACFYIIMLCELPKKKTAKWQISQITVIRDGIFGSYKECYLETEGAVFVIGIGQSNIDEIIFVGAINTFDLSTIFICMENKEFLSLPDLDNLYLLFELRQYIFGLPDDVHSKLVETMEDVAEYYKKISAPKTVTLWQLGTAKGFFI